MPSIITIFTYTHHGIISAIGVEVEAVYRVGIEIGSVIYGDESANFRIVIAGFQVVKPGLFIVIISAITERVQFGKRFIFGIIFIKRRFIRFTVLFFVVYFVQIQCRMVAPRIVLIFYHNIPVAVNKCANIP